MSMSIRVTDHPYNITNATQGFENTRAELNRLVAKTKAEDDRPAFYIESPVTGYCGLCNVPGCACSIFCGAAGWLGDGA